MGSIHWTDEESAYLKAILSWEDKSESEKAADRLAELKRKAVGEFRVLVVGAKGCGKTSILTRFGNGSFREDSEQPDPFFERGCRHVVEVDSQYYMVDALEMPSKHLSSTQMLEQAINITEAALVIYDVSDRASLDLAKSVHDIIKTSIGNGSHHREYGLLLVGNKSDVDDQHERQVSWAEGNKAAAGFALRCAFLEVSAKTGDNVGSVFPHLGREILRIKWLNQQRHEERAAKEREMATAIATTPRKKSVLRKKKANAPGPQHKKRFGIWKTLTTPFLRR